MSNEKTLDNIIINAKVIALMELKEKITKEIVDLYFFRSYFYLADFP